MKGGRKVTEEIAQYKNESVQIAVEDIKKYITPNATDKELFMFMGICKSYNLNPFKREIHFVKYGTNAASIIVGYENYLKRAERTGKLDGWKCWIEKDDVGEKAIIEIKRKDQSLPVHWEVYRKEFDKQQSTWKTMPTFMLKKVAIAQGFRLAFPDDLGGMPYIPEELPQTKDITSETLSKEIIDIAEEQSSPAMPDNLSLIPPAPSPDAPEPPQLLLSGSPLHKKIEAKIGEENINRDMFKNYLLDIGKIGFLDEKPSFKTMTIENAQKMLDKWEATLKAFERWRLKNAGEGQNEHITSGR